jgi:hypothetical protein
MWWRETDVLIEVISIFSVAHPNDDKDVLSGYLPASLSRLFYSDQMLCGNVPDRA